MKLTHPAVELCVLLPIGIDDKIKGVFQKCACLYALETTTTFHCRQCPTSFTNNSLSVLTSFPLLTYYCTRLNVHHCSITFVRDIINGYKNLKYLKITHQVKGASQCFMSTVQS